MPWVRNSTLEYKGDRRTYDVYQQDLPGDCTVAGLIMLAKYALNNREVPFTIARLWVRQSQQHFFSDLKAYLDQDAPKMHAPVDGTPYLWGCGGSAVAAVCFAFRRYFPNHQWEWLSPHGTPDNGSLPDRLARCTPRTPALVKIQWDGNPTSHAVLNLGVGGAVYFSVKCGFSTRI